MESIEPDPSPAFFAELQHIPPTFKRHVVKWGVIFEDPRTRQFCALTWSGSFIVGATMN